MNPACEIDEYASSRFTSRCASAARFPQASEMHAITATAIVQTSASLGNAVTSTRRKTTSAAVFVAADMNAVTEVGAPWYTSGVHMWNGAAETLNARPARIIASPARRNASSVGSAVGDLGEADLAGRAVDERGAEEEHRRAEAADDQVLEAGLERGGALGVERDEDVEAEREPLEPEEERHQVLGAHEEDHPRAGSREQRVVLAVVVATALGPGDEDDDGTGDREDHLGERGELVARHRLSRGDLGVALSSKTTPASTAASTKPASATVAVTPLRIHPGTSTPRGARGPSAEQRERRREREPVDASASRSPEALRDRLRRVGRPGTSSR